MPVCRLAAASRPRTSPRARGSTLRPLGVARTAFFFTLQPSRSIEASVYLQLPSLGA